MWVRRERDWCFKLLSARLFNGRKNLLFSVETMSFGFLQRILSSTPISIRRTWICYRHRYLCWRYLVIRQTGYRWSIGWLWTRIDRWRSTKGFRNQIGRRDWITWRLHTERTKREKEKEREREIWKGTDMPPFLEMRKNEGSIRLNILTCWKIGKRINKIDHWFLLQRGMICLAGRPLAFFP